METARQPRIVIEDLPALEQLSDEMMEQIFGAGRPSFRPSIEMLEDRQLMAAGLTASLSGGILKIQDQNPGDIVHVRELNNQISIDGISSITGAGGATVAISAVSQIQIQALGNNDAIDLSGLLQGQPTLPAVEMNFGTGSDTLTLPGISTPVTIPGDSMTLGGHTLSNVMLTFDNSSLTVQGSATLPVVGAVNLSGSVSADATTYSLTAPLSSVSVGGFTLTNDTVTFNNSGLGLSGQVTLPLLGQQTLSGTIGNDGSYVATLTKPESLLGGMVQFSKTTLTFSGDTATINASATVADGIGQATFVGSIGADGSYALTAGFNVSIAGFTLPDEGGTLTLGNTPSANSTGASGTALGVSFSMQVPGLEDDSGDPVDISFSGSYGPGGQWSLSGTYPGPVQAGPVTLTDLTVTLNNTSLTLSAVGSIADLQDLVDAKATATITTNGQVTMTVVPKVLSLGNYSAATATITVTNATPGRDWTMTIKAQVNIPGIPSPLTLSGLVDAQGNYTLIGTSDITVAGVTLQQADFTLIKGQGITFTDTFSYYGFTFDVSGGVGTGGQVQFQGGAAAGGDGFQFANGQVNVDLDPTTNTYSIQLSGDVDLPMASLQFNATVGRNAQGVWNQPTLQCTAPITGPLATILAGSATFTLTPTEVTFHGTVSIPKVPGASYTVQGTVLANGTVLIGGYAGTLGSLAAQDAAKIWNAADVDATTIAKGLKSTFNTTAQDAANFLQAAGAAVSDITTAINSVFSGSTWSITWNSGVNTIENAWANGVNTLTYVWNTSSGQNVSQYWVSGTQVGPMGLVVRKSVVFQIPPAAVPR